jgi:hypothetical protein
VRQAAVCWSRWLCVQNNTSVTTHQLVVRPEAVRCRLALPPVSMSVTLCLLVVLMRDSGWAGTLCQARHRSAVLRSSSLLRRFGVWAPVLKSGRPTCMAAASVICATGPVQYMSCVPQRPCVQPTEVLTLRVAGSTVWRGFRLCRGMPFALCGTPHRPHMAGACVRQHHLLKHPV